MTSEAERQFHRDMVLGMERLKREIDYNATRFMQMVGEYGDAKAARSPLSGRDASDGFTTLWEHGRPEMSVDAHVLLSWYRGLFSGEQAGDRRARQRTGTGYSTRQPMSSRHNARSSSSRSTAPFKIMM